MLPDDDNVQLNITKKIFINHVIESLRVVIMNVINNSDTVIKQYKSATNLNTRISIHSKYSVNKMGFGNWIISRYEIKDGMRILELGCGTGDMWKNHINLLDYISEIILTDFSEGMLDSAKEILGENKHISYKVVDIQDIPFEDKSFDMVIGNMMLYHVPEIDKGLAEVQRVLKKNGVFYCATYGENGIVEYILSLLRSYNAQSKTNKNFTLQNGRKILSNHFDDVIRFDYEDALEVTNVDDMIDYIYSLSSMSNISSIKREELKQTLEDNLVDGILRVPKEYGMFKCKKP